MPASAKVRYDSGMMTRMRLVALCLALGACDPQVKQASGGVQGASMAPANPSHEAETCAATPDCQAPLRCVDGACRSATTSRLGQYYWTAGELAAKKSDWVHASESFQQAMGQFEAEKIPTPPDLLCSYGAALRRKPNDPKASEQAARLLHRCVLATAPGAPAYRTAMEDLVELEAVGLDPSLLARDTPADTYLVRPSKKLTADHPTLEIVQSSPSTDAGYAAFIEAAKAQETAYDKCYETWFASTQKPTMAVELKLKHRVVIGDDDLVVGAKLDVTAPSLTGAEAAASACVRAALDATVADFGKPGKSSGNWDGAITITLKSVAP